MIAIIDYNAGNSRSVINALKRLGIDAELTSNQTDIRNADKVIFPGVGHANSAMETLRKTGMNETIIKLEKPFLGICLGMQLMCTRSEEGNTDCLGIFNENAKLFPSSSKVPHIGWNNLSHSKTQLFNQIENDDNFYFVHSYYVEQGEDTIGSCNYSLPFSAALNKRNFFGVQFHPEKSGSVGDKLLKNFLSL